MTLHVPPDLVRIVLDFLAGNDDVAALVDAAPSSKIPNPRPDRHLQVIRVDGGYRDARAAWTDGAFLDIHARAEDDATADLVARTARAALMQIVGYEHVAGVVVNVEDVGGPHNLPDPDTTPPTDRSVFSIHIEAHPNP